ncbi:YdeI/OmpD-associated family protein [Namhaeicola litoreus]|uniref:YdeI family protein n=1 Tax=Namhaeicola litoreus TaxID=1052145 RepID=A0ABW3Y766_9FLAO
MSDKVIKIEAYFNQANFKDKLLQLRSVFIDLGLTETLKWGIPTYTYLGKNIVGLASFKNHFGIWFFQGAMLSNPLNYLIAGQKKTIAMRQLKYKPEDIIDKTIIRSFVLEAMENTKNQIVISPKKSKELLIPELLKKELDANVQLFEKFNAFSLTDKRDFTEYICTAKKTETQERRLSKVVSYIEAGIGLNDKYKKK